jgi:transposase-like protein
VEQRGPGTPGKKPVPGFAALKVVPDAAADTLEGFLKSKVRPGSHILTDGWRGYRRLKKKGF